jgi:hypothetical protein
MADKDFDIDFTYKGNKEYRFAFEEAAERWEEIITADLPDIGKIDDLQINVKIVSIDGKYGILGQAGPTSVRVDGGLPCKGVMEFDRADMQAMKSDGSLTAVITHEMGHVLGLGTLWDYGDFDFVNKKKGGYTGENALEQYRKLTGNPTASYVPLETGGGEGTAHSHWSEALFDDEAMTGYANGDMPISRVTVGALEDLGYRVDYSQADTFGI